MYDKLLFEWSRIILTQERHGGFCFIQPENFKYSNLPIVPIKGNKDFKTDGHL